MNLLFSTQAAYAAPIIMMAQNRQSQRDRAQADSDYHTNVAAKKEIEEVMSRLDSIEIESWTKSFRCWRRANEDAIYLAAAFLSVWVCAPR